MTQETPSAAAAAAELGPRISLPDGLLAHIQHAGDPEFRYREMRYAVEALRSTNCFFLPLLTLVTALIDGLASGRRGTSKKAYLHYLQVHFPELVAAMPADEFYENYRCGAVHEFSPKSGFAIGRGFGMNGAYVAVQRFPELGTSITMLNIDRLIDDFLRHLIELEQNLRRTSGSTEVG